MLATSATDISTTLLFCQKHSIDFATRGGGHASSGASFSDSGIVIDLFWAIRGAGQSFGVVTEFTYPAHPQPNPV